jgi:thioredoxin 2
MPTTSSSILRACAACGRANRIPVAHLADRGRCGACRAELPPLDEPLDVDIPTFDAIVASARVPILVDFWAAWCGPCKVAAPHVASVAKRAAGRAIVLKVDTDQYPALGARFGVQGIPNFVVISNGKVVRQQAGAVDANAMESWLS